jgi:hypothetical protein
VKHLNWFLSWLKGLIYISTAMKLENMHVDVIYEHSLCHLVNIYVKSLTNLFLEEMNSCTTTDITEFKISKKPSQVINSEPCLRSASGITSQAELTPVSSLTETENFFVFNRNRNENGNHSLEESQTFINHKQCLHLHFLV